MNAFHVLIRKYWNLVHVYQIVQLVIIMLKTIFAKVFSCFILFHFGLLILFSKIFRMPIALFNMHRIRKWAMFKLYFSIHSKWDILYFRK